MLDEQRMINGVSGACILLGDPPAFDYVNSMTRTIPQIVSNVFPTAYVTV